MNLWANTTAVGVLMTSLWVNWGCQSAPQPHVFSDTSASGKWQLWPQSMRVHPLTRVINQTDESPPIVELRIEFIDPIGHPSKSTGQIAITYSDKVGSIRNIPPVGLWETDLRDLQVNESHWDNVTDTYLYRFPLPTVNAGKRGMLRVIMLQEDGNQFDDVFALEIPDPPKSVDQNQPAGEDGDEDTPTTEQSSP